MRNPDADQCGGRFSLTSLERSDREPQATAFPLLEESLPMTAQRLVVALTGLNIALVASTFFSRTRPAVAASAQCSGDAPWRSWMIADGSAPVLRCYQQIRPSRCRTVRRDIRKPYCCA